MQFNLKSILFLLVIFLLGTNVAVIVVYQYHLKSEQVKVEKQIEAPANQFGKFFTDELNLNADQQDKFREFRRTYNRSANQVLLDMESIRGEMAKQLNTVHPNRGKLNQLSEELGEKHKLLKNLTFDYYFNMQSVLNEDQHAKMVVIFQSMLTREGEVLTPRQGGQGQKGPGQSQGRRQGWRSEADTMQKSKY
jgi:hypothetical protein